MSATRTSQEHAQHTVWLGGRDPAEFSGTPLGTRDGRNKMLRHLTPSERKSVVAAALEAHTVVEQATDLAIYNPATLTRFDEGCRVLAEATSVADVMEANGISDLMKAAARFFKNRDQEINAMELKVRSHRRLGEMIALQGEQFGLNTGAKGVGKKSAGEKSPTLDGMGVGKDLAKIARKTFKVDTKFFEAAITEWRSEDAEAVAEAKSSAKALPKVKNLRVFPKGRSAPDADKQPDIGTFVLRFSASLGKFFVDREDKLSALVKFRKDIPDREKKMLSSSIKTTIAELEKLHQKLNHDPEKSATYEVGAKVVELTKRD